MKSIQRSPSRAELDARVRDLRLQSWRRRSVAALVAAALAAGTVSPAISYAEPGGWGPSESSSSRQLDRSSSAESSGLDG